MVGKKIALDKIRIEDHPELQIDLEEGPGEDGVVIVLKGLIDTYNSDFYQEQIAKLLKMGFRNLYVNCSGLTFMSSTGIGAFTALLKSLRERRGEMVLYSMPPKIYKVFQLLGFSTFFRFCGSREEAAANYKTAPVPAARFPVIFSCPICGRKLKAVKSGRFRCSSCKVILAVDKRGEFYLG